MNTISAEGYDVEECPPVTSTYGWNGEECPCVVVEYSAIGCCEDFAPHHYEHVYDSLDGTRDAARRHDALARRKYVKPFKWFKFNRARRATAK